MATQNFIDDTIRLYNKYIHPALFTEIERGPIWPVIAAAAFLVLVALEVIQDRTYMGTRPSNASERIDYAILRLNQKQNMVGWRISLIVSILLSLIILFIFTPTLPNGFDFFLVTMFLFTIIYLGINWFYWHWHKPNDSKYEKELLNLRHQIKDMEIQQDLNQFKTDDAGYKTVLQRIESILKSPNPK